MSAQAATTGTVTAPEEGEEIHITPLEPVRVLLSGETGAETDLLEITMAPGGGPPVHVHSGQEENFVVLDGTMSARIGDDTVEVGPGGALHIPAGVPHAPFNPTDGDVRALIIGTAGFVPYFREIGEVITDWPPTEDMLEACAPIMERYGVEMIGPPPLAPDE